MKRSLYSTQNGPFSSSLLARVYPTETNGIETQLNVYTEVSEINTGQNVEEGPGTRC